MPIRSSFLFRTLAGAAQLDAPTIVTINGYGSISIYPGEFAYTSDIVEWAALPMNNASIVKVTAGVWFEAPRHALLISELCWRMRFYSALQTGEDLSSRSGLLVLARWPDLGDIPDNLVAPVARICALLWRKPCLCATASTVLDADHRQTEALIQVLRSLGFVKLVPAFGAAPVLATPVAQHSLPPVQKLSSQSGLAARVRHGLDALMGSRYVHGVRHAP